MRHFVLILAAISMLTPVSRLASTQLAERPARDRTETLEHDGVKRTYLVHLPRRFDPEKAHPLVFAIHGGGGRADRFDRSTRGTMTAAADARGFVVVFPQGVNKQWNDGRTEHIQRERGRAQTHDDVGFFEKLIDTMHEKHGIDRDRVFATGISNGGFMSMRLAVDLSDKIAAVAPVTAQLSKAIADRRPARPISVMIVNGTADPLVPFDGGHVRLGRFGRSRGEILSTADTIERFRKHNECTAHASVTKIPNRNRFDGSHATITRYTGGLGETEVVLVRVVDGGHTWPGGQQYLPKRVVGTVCRDFDASAMILDFFLRHRRTRRAL